MRKFYLLMLCLALCGCDRLRAPVGPTSTIAFEGYITDVEENVDFANETILLNGTQMRLEKKGRFRAVEKSINAITSLSPYFPTSRL